MAHRLFIIPALFTALLVTGCATKKFVREEVQKVDAKTTQSVSRLDGELGQERGRVDGLTVQVTDVGKRADQANGLAGQAANRAEAAAQKADQASGAADQAVQRADQTDTRLTRLWANRHKLNPAETVVIRFGFDRAKLDDRGETSLLDVVKQLQENPNLFVTLEGYTDSQGPADYNVQLSQRRVETVRRFLVEKGVELHRVQSIGLGVVKPVANNGTKEGRAENRRVAVRVLTPAE